VKKADIKQPEILPSTTQPDLTREQGQINSVPGGGQLPSLNFEKQYFSIILLVICILWNFFPSWIV
jgi:hypothetical protein